MDDSDKAFQSWSILQFSSSSLVTTHEQEVIVASFEPVLCVVIYSYERMIAEFYNTLIMIVLTPIAIYFTEDNHVNFLYFARHFW